MNTAGRGITYVTHGACKPIHNLWHCGVTWHASHRNLTRASALTAREYTARIRAINEAMPHTKVLVIALSPESTREESPTYRAEIFALLSAARMGVNRVVLVSEAEQLNMLRRMRSDRSACIVAVPQASLIAHVAKLARPPKVHVVENFAPEHFVSFSREISQMYES
jgi:hypothetical protein